MKMLRISIILGVTILMVSCFSKKLAKKSGLGCKVCIHGDKNAKHTGLCTVFIKKESSDKEVDKDQKSCTQE